MGEEKRTIKSIPKISKEIIDAFNEQKLVLFIGAGVSALTGLPLWGELANLLAKTCIERGCISYKDSEIIFSKINDSKQKISVVFELFKKHGLESEFYETLSDLLTIDEPKDDAKAIFDFCQWTNATVLTTNADLLLDKYFEDSLIFSDVKDFVFNENTAALFKIHGSVDNPNSLVFTAEQYLHRYSDKKFCDFLEQIFNSDITVLFLGYGMSEFELIEFLIKHTSNTNKYFFLAPYFEYELPLMESMELYYKSIGVTLVPYSRDENNYSQLSILIKNWKDDIEKTTNITSSKISQVRRLINNPNNYNKLVQMTKSNKYIESTFYKEVASSNLLEEWMDKLIDTELMDPEKCIFNCIANEENWKGLDFYARNVQQINNKELKNRFINVIINSIEYILEHPEAIKSFSLITTISELITKFNENVIGNELLTSFIDVVYVENGQDISKVTYGFFKNKIHIFEWDNKSIDALFKALIPKIEIDYNVRSFWVKDLSGSIFPVVSGKVSVEVFKKLVYWFEEHEIGEDRFKFSYIGSFAEDYNKTINKDDIPTLIMNMCKSFIENSHCNFNELEKWLSDIINESSCNSRVLKKLYIYLISERFKDLRHCLFHVKGNPFENWDLYGDLYCLIQKNNANLSDRECKQLKDWINNSSFGNKPEDYLKIIKYDFYDLLSKEHTEFNSIKENYYSDRHDEVLPILDRNKDFIMHSTRWGPDNKDILLELENKDFSEIIEYFTKAKPDFWHSNYDYHDAFETIIKKNPQVLKEHIDLIKKLPMNYYRSIVNCFEWFAELDEDDLIFELLKIIVPKVMIVHEEYGVFNSIFSSLKKLYLSNKTDGVTAQIIEYKNIISAILAQTKDYFATEYSYNDEEQPISIKLYNCWFTEGINSLLTIYAILKDNNFYNDELRVLFDNTNLIEGKNKYLIKSVLAYRYETLCFIDTDLAKANLPIIIDDFDSATAFMYNSFLDKDVYYQLVNIGYYDQIFNTNNNIDEAIKYNLAAFAVHVFVIFGVDTSKQLKTIINSKYQNTIYWIFNAIASAIEKSNNKTNARKVLGKACKMVNPLIMSQRISCNDQIMRYLAKCINLLNSTNSEYWNLLETLSKRFDNYLSEELHDCLLAFYSKKKKLVISIVCNIAELSDWAILDVEREYADLIMKIRNDDSVKEDFNRINNILIQKGINGFVE